MRAHDRAYAYSNSNANGLGFKPIMQTRPKKYQKNKGKLCGKDGCARAAAALGLCLQHYKRSRPGYAERRRVEKRRQDKANPEAHRARCRRWGRSQRGKAWKRSARRLRRAKLKNACPKWVDRREIQRIYLNCPRGMQVDHFYPLKSDFVCGLHVPWNLQYLTPVENARKGNSIPEASRAPRQ